MLKSFTPLAPFSIHCLKKLFTSRCASSASKMSESIKNVAELAGDSSAAAENNETSADVQKDAVVSTDNGSGTNSSATLFGFPVSSHVPRDRDLRSEAYWKHKRKREKEKKKVKREREVPLAAETKKARRAKRDRDRQWKETADDELVMHDPTVVVDCSFTKILTYRENKSLKNQLSFTYGSFKRSAKRLKLVYSSLAEPVTSQLVSIGSENWRGIQLETRDVSEIFPVERLVYLSPDSPNLIDKLEADKVYVIGGIVDHNRLKNASLERAKELGCSTARFPILEAVGVKLFNSLNVNHVFDILQAYAEHDEPDWCRAIILGSSQRCVTPKYKEKWKALEEKYQQEAKEREEQQAKELEHEKERREENGEEEAEMAPLADGGPELP